MELFQSELVRSGAVVATSQAFEKEIFAAYIANLAAKASDSDNRQTQITYSSRLKEFFRYLDGLSDTPRNLSELRRSHIVSYINHLIEIDKTPRTVNTSLSAIRSFCRYLGRENIVANDLCFGVEFVPLVKNSKTNTAKVKTTAFKKDEVQKLFEALNPKSKYYTHYRVILAVGFYTGLRSHEIQNIRVGDIVFDGECHLLTARIKGHKEKTDPLHPEAIKAVNSHLNYLQSNGFNVNSDLYLFPSIHYKTNTPYSHSAMRKIIQKLMIHAGIEVKDGTKYTSHSMRATAITHLNDIGVPIREIMEFVGHSNTETTAAYIQSEKEHSKGLRLGWGIIKFEYSIGKCQE